MTPYNSNMDIVPDLLVIVRHAESARNLAKAGQVFFADESARADLKHEPDHLTCLTETGKEQASALGEQLLAAFGSFDLVFHSGYTRTRETAERLLQAWSAEERSRIGVRHHLFLRERDVGYAFNMTASEASREFPWLQAHWDLFGRFFARPPGGESLADVATRIHLFLEDLKCERVGKRVLVVTHGGSLRMFRYLLEGWTYEDVVERWDREPVPTCAVVAYRQDGDSGRLVRLQLPGFSEPSHRPNR